MDNFNATAAAFIRNSCCTHNVVHLSYLLIAQIVFVVKRQHVFVWGAAAAVYWTTTLALLVVPLFAVL